ncbi:MAG: histidinol-phosphatase [Actinomycetota bacterium]|jgi:histidinol-phosphatase|nr:histidinol-phosphatase [Actinomycetota bacterium]
MNDYSSELEFALELAQLGGRLAMGHYRNDPKSEKKADGTWVTEADWAVEAQIRLRIARSWPEHNILGEEEGLTAAGGGAPIEGAPTWVIDPIDGTNNYMAGIPIWATLVGLRIDGLSVVGVAHAPALDETYDAAIDMGARCNGESISTDEGVDLKSGTLLHAGFPNEGEPFDKFLTELSAKAARTRGFGDFWGHMLVARGAAHAMVEPELSIWDVAALEPIVTEAGGRISTLTGKPFEHHGSCVSCASSLAETVYEAANRYGVS